MVDTVIGVREIDGFCHRCPSPDVRPLVGGRAWGIVFTGQHKFRISHWVSCITYSLVGKIKRELIRKNFNIMINVRVFFSKVKCYCKTDWTMHQRP